MQALPETSQFSGEFGFELSFGPPTPGATKSIDYTYSHPLKKLYVQRGAHCPFKFKSKRPPPEGSYIKVLPVYKGTHVLSEPVKRCSNHAVGEEEAGNPDGKQIEIKFCIWLDIMFIVSWADEFDVKLSKSISPSARKSPVEVSSPQSGSCTLYLVAGHWELLTKDIRCSRLNRTLFICLRSVPFKRFSSSAYVKRRNKWKES